MTSGLTDDRIREIEEEIEEKVDEHAETIVLLQELIAEVKRLRAGTVTLMRASEPPWLAEIAMALTTPGKPVPTLNWAQVLQEARRLRTRFTKVVSLLREIGLAAGEEYES